MTQSVSSFPSTHFNKPLPLSINTGAVTKGQQPSDAVQPKSPIYQYPSPLPRTSTGTPASARTVSSPLSTIVSSETVQTLQRLISDVCVVTNLLNSRVKDNWEFLAKILAIKQAFHANQNDLVAFCSAHIDNLASPLSPTDAVVQGSNMVEILDRSLYDLQAAMTILGEQVRKANKSFPPPSVRRHRIKKCVEEAWKAWTTLTINLTLAKTTSSSVLAETATSNVAKIAIATGNPDWEILDEVNANALLASGDKYFMGYGVAKNYETAFKRYSAASRHSAEACNMMGVMFENGYGCVKNIGTATTWYRKSGDRGFGEGYNNLGRIHENGVGVESDLTVARENYQKAAESGCLDAMVNFGLCLENGVEIEKSLSKARVWYEKAAEMGFARAQNCLGNVFYAGKGVKRDYSKAVVYFKKAADQGNPHAQNNLGICYESGLGVGRDLALAKWLYKSASETGHASATNNLGWMCLIEKSYMEAFKLFVLAANQGSVEALYNIGTMYEHGCADSEGVVCRKDPELAVRFWRDAAKQANVKAQLRLGLMLTCPPEGFSQIENAREGFNWIEEAAHNGLAEGMYQLGNCYENAIGVESDLARARKWYERACDLEYPRAVFRMGYFYENGIAAVRDLTKAVRLYVEAEKLGSREARSRLTELKDMAN